ncbi:dihydroneopterin aldolase [Paraglaciecola sp. L3A3]|uniref:dihydroneopterin aldolase n=1 Tax=Paraglaciecola sp. L3A3 TaxID=2686358 RepID=UPI00131B75D5|nr:dihydroneopterin aldolase [Paraglaciecola sp. L3A3]
MDKIHIERLEVLSLIGVYDWERKNKQRLILDIELQADLSIAAHSDNVDDTLNYALVAQTLADEAKCCDFKLIEALASHLIDCILKSFPAVKIARLKLSKPDILANAKNVAVEFTRERAV